MSDKAWKACERAIARILGGKRVGATGTNSPDVVTDRFAVEVKMRRTFPHEVWAAMDQAEQNAGKRMPLVVMHRHGARHEYDLVVLRLADFVTLTDDAE